MRYKYTVEVLAPVVRVSTNYWQVVQALGLKPSGAANHRLKQVIKELNIPTDHFIRNPTGGRGHRVPMEDRLVNDRCPGKRENGQRLREAMLSVGFEETCDLCHLPALWQGKPLCLHIDHKNGLGTDNRTENLRFLCPNCHSQTDTYCGRNKRGKKQSS